MEFLKLSCAGSGASSGATPPSETFTEIYNVADTGSTYSLLGTADNDSVGERANTGSALIGSAIKRVQFRLKKTGTPTGNITFLIKDSGGTIVYTFGTLDASTLTASDANYIITGTTSYTLASGDRILAEYSGGNSSNTVDLKRTGSDAFDGTATHRQSRNAGSSSYSSQTDQDVIGIFYSSNL